MRRSTTVRDVQLALVTAERDRFRDELGVVSKSQQQLREESLRATEAAAAAAAALSQEKGAALRDADAVAAKHARDIEGLKVRRLRCS
jgi:hypothetical protein